MLEEYEVERRDFKRLAVAMKVVEEHAWGRSEAEVLDLCELGMRYVKSASAPRCDDRQVMLEFCLPGDERPVRLRGWIASEEVQSEVRFLSVTFAFPSDVDAERVCRHLARADA
jgi:hypothetical protein